MTADKPRADLVALLLQFEATAGNYSDLHLTGEDAGPAVAAWAESRGHYLDVATRTRRDGGKTLAWTSYTVLHQDPRWTVTCSLHDDHEVTAPPAQADQQVLARVQAALDGESPLTAVGRLSGPEDYECTSCGETMQRYDQFGEYQHEGCGGLVQRKQPWAAKGSV